MTIDDVLARPAQTMKTIDLRTGQPATAYYRPDGNYLVRNDVTGDVIQMSNVNALQWFDTVRSQWRGPPDGN